MGKCALVTGAGTGIGRGIALTLAEAGYDVGVHYRSSELGAAEVCHRIRGMGRRAEVYQADLTSLTQIEDMFHTYRADFGAPDVFVNNAGITKKAPFLKTTPALFDEVCGTDFRGAFFCIQNAAKLMIEEEIRGSIVLIASNNAAAHFADVSVYGSVKAAAVKLAEHAALELSPLGIRVNIVSPGWTDTGAVRLGKPEDTYYKVPLHRWATPEEIGKTVLFLCGDAAASITGANLVVDGGALLQSDKPSAYGFSEV